MAESDPKQEELKLQALMNKVCDRLGKTQEEFMKEFADEIAKVKTTQATLDELTQKRRARASLTGLYREQMRSPAVMFAGVLLCAMPAFDQAERPRRDAAVIYQADPQKAKDEGWVDIGPNGEMIPLDRKAKFKTSGKDNPNFGKQLPIHDYIGNIFGIGTFGDTTKTMNLVLSGPKAIELEKPMNTAVTFRANISEKKTTDLKWELTQSAYTEFTPQTVDASIAPNIEQILAGEMCDPYKVKLSPATLNQYHETNGKNPTRMAIIQGEVQYMSPEPNAKTDNRLMVLFDLDLMEVDEDGVSVWLPPHLDEIAKTIGKGSQVYALGQTSSTTFREKEQILMNAGGLYAIPEYLRAPDEEFTKAFKAVKVA